MIDPRNYFAPFIGGPGLQIQVGGGILMTLGTSTTLPQTTVPLVANATNYVYLNPTLGSFVANTTGFPTSQCYPIAVAVTTTNTVTTLTDYRPDAGPAVRASAADLNNGTTGSGAVVLATAATVNAQALTTHVNPTTGIGWGFIVANDEATGAPDVVNLIGVARQGVDAGHIYFGSSTYPVQFRGAMTALGVDATGLVYVNSPDPTTNFLDLRNSTPATNVLSQSSPKLYFDGNYWNGSASGVDEWSVADIIANGTNGTSTLTIGHTGSSGAASVSVPSLTTPTIVLNAQSISNVPVIALGVTLLNSVTSGGVNWSTWIPAGPITIVRMEVRIDSTTLAGYTTSPPTIRLTNGATNVDLPIPNGPTAYADTGVISQNYAAGGQLSINCLAGSGGTGTTGNAHIVIQYKMQ